MFSSLNYDITVRPSVFAQTFFELSKEDAEEQGKRSFGAIPVSLRDANRKEILSSTYYDYLKDRMAPKTVVNFEQMMNMYEHDLRERAARKTRAGSLAEPTLEAPNDDDTWIDSQSVVLERKWDKFVKAKSDSLFEPKIIPAVIM
eukprot:NODE_146_length_17563_cov_0.253321.p8 type:complete len:145 gc:universal NODE_146_length_17563_cov_0.253321:15494-15060(-)